MWLLVTFITLWAISPGPVFITTLQETRKHGVVAGIAVSAGAAATAILMVIAALVIHSTGFTALLDSPNMAMIEQVGAVGIILMGLYAAYSCFTNSSKAASNDVKSKTKVGFFQGMGMMATGTPQALLFYTIITPQTVGQESLMTMIIALGALKVAMVFGWHAGVALVAARSHHLMGGSRFKVTFEVALASLLVVMGANMLI